MGDRIDSSKKILEPAQTGGKCLFGLNIKDTRISGIFCLNRFINTLCGGGADLFNEQKNTIPADLIIRIRKHPKMCQHVLDMGGFHKFKPPDFNKRNRQFAQFYLKIERVKTGSKKHGNLIEGNPLFPVRPDFVYDKLRLAVFIACRYENRLGPA